MNPNFPPPDFIQTKSAIEGISVYKPKPAELEQPAEVIFTCPQCGATTSFSITEQALACPHCGYQEAPEAVTVGSAAPKNEFQVETVRAANRGWGEERNEIHCEQCGADISLPAGTISHTCSFCGSNRVVNRTAQQEGLQPKFVIPFLIQAQACRKIAHEWLGSSWMTPSTLQQVSSIGSFNPIYLPYWTFSALCSADWRAEVAHMVTETYRENGETKTRTRIEWRWESGDVTKNFDNLLQPGTNRLSHNLLGQINNFNLDQLVEYDSKFLAGVQAQAYDIALEPAWDSGREVMREETRHACEGQATGSPIRNFSMSLDFADEAWRYILAPVYTSIYQYEGKTYQVLINGQTGSAAGPRPVDWQKVWLVIALILSPGLLLSLVGFITLVIGIGALIGMIGVVLLIIGAGVSWFIYNKAQEMQRD